MDDLSYNTEKLDLENDEEYIKIMTEYHETCHASNYKKYDIILYQGVTSNSNFYLLLLNSTRLEK
jgi:hypothetical protein